MTDLAILLFWTALVRESSSSPAAPVAPAVEDKSAKAAKPAAAPVSDPNLTYTYNPFGKRDPFRSFISEKTLNMKDSKDPLLNFDLSKFMLTGIVWGISNPKAIVVDGEGRGHIISRGTRMGRNRGQVVRILKEEVIVAEEYRDPLGKLMVSETSLKLSKEDRK